MKNKLSKEQIEEIKKLYLNGVKKMELARKFNVSLTCINYHLDEKAKSYMKNYQIDRFKKLSPERKKELYLNKKAYLRNYFRNKYQTNEVFREKEKKRHRKL